MQIKHKPDGKTNELEIIPIDELAEVRGWKALGSKLNYAKLVEVVFLDTEDEAPTSEAVAPEPVEIEEAEEVIASVEKEAEIKLTEVEPASEEPEFVVNFPTEKSDVPESSIDEIPFEIKNPPNGEQLGLF